MNPVLHVMVVGFDHKKGNQIDFCYPPLGESVEPKSEDVPPGWENLPSLAIPDQAHNAFEDVIYFLLPSRESPNRTIFGISCYRQIEAKDLIAKDEQVTRSHVQKSVVVLTRIPLYGFLKAKLELITQAYFNERDFRKVEVLHQMYNNLCDLFDANFDYTQGATLGISLSPLISIFRHRILILFKLLLLEKRVMFEIFPVNILGDVLIGLISLFPALLEEGLFEAASYSVRRYPSQRSFPIEESHELIKDSSSIKDQANVASTISDNEVKVSIQEGIEEGQDVADFTVTNGQTSSNNNPSSFNTDEYGFPLSILSKGSLFHPYLSINQLETIRSDSTRAYCIGVTNAIFKQRREFIDVIVTINEQKDGQIEIINPELRSQLSLSTQDIRFMDFILKNYDQNNDPTFWEGSDEWVRSQFHSYLMSLLVVAKSGSEEKVSEFNESFIVALRTKHNYRVWSSQNHLGLANADIGHMFSGQFSGNDLLLRVGHSEPGRKMISTLTSTSKLVSQTGSRLKSSISSWIQRSDSNKISHQ